MDNTPSNSSNKTLLKILIGAAWLDGQMQPEERVHLQRIAREQNLAEESDIRPMLHELVPVRAEECYAWIRQYLGDRPNITDYQRLLDAISGLIYSDGTVAIEEAKLLNRLQLIDPEVAEPEAFHKTALRTIRHFYQDWINHKNK